MLPQLFNLEHNNRSAEMSTQYCEPSTPMVAPSTTHFQPRIAIIDGKTYVLRPGDQVTISYANTGPIKHDPAQVVSDAEQGHSSTYTQEQLASMVQAGPAADKCLCEYSASHPPPPTSGLIAFESEFTKVSSWDEADKEANKGRAVLMPDGTLVIRRWCYYRPDGTHEYRVW